MNEGHLLAHVWSSNLINHPKIQTLNFRLRSFENVPRCWYKCNVTSLDIINQFDRFPFWPKQGYIRWTPVASAMPLVGHLACKGKVLMFNWNWNKQVAKIVSKLEGAWIIGLYSRLRPQFCLSWASQSLFAPVLFVFSQQCFDYNTAHKVVWSWVLSQNFLQSDSFICYHLLLTALKLVACVLVMCRCIRWNCSAIFLEPELIDYICHLDHPDPL